MEDEKWGTKSDAEDLISSPQNGGGKPEVAERHVKAQWPC